jgi:hypothetical protein
MADRYQLFVLRKHTPAVWVSVFTAYALTGTYQCYNSEEAVGTFYRLAQYRNTFETLSPFRHWAESIRRGICPKQGLYLQRTSQHRKRWTNVQALTGIRTYGLSVRTVDTHTVDDVLTKMCPFRPNSLSSTKWAWWAFISLGWK